MRISNKLKKLINYRLTPSCDLAPNNVDAYWQEVQDYMVARYKYNKDTFIYDDVVSYHISAYDIALNIRFISYLYFKHGVHPFQKYKRNNFFDLSGQVAPLYRLHTTELSQLVFAHYVKDRIKLEGKTICEFGIGSCCFPTAIESFPKSEIEYIGYDFKSMVKICKDRLSGKNLKLTSDITTFHDALNNKSVFISHFALSESPLELRNKIMDGIKNCCGFAIVYQSSFNEVDNLLYFASHLKELNQIGFEVSNIRYKPYGKSAYIVYGSKK